MIAYFFKTDTRKFSVKNLTDELVAVRLPTVETDYSVTVKLTVFELTCYCAVVILATVKIVVVRAFRRN